MHACSSPVPFAVKRIAAAIGLASLLFSASAAAATYQYRAYIPGLSPAAGAGPAAATPLMLLAGSSLPSATINQAYVYDLKQLLSVTGDSTYSSANVSWNVVTGYSLPAGLSLSSAGVISGMPSVKDTAGTEFQVVASYKAQTQQQAYTIIINGVTLRVTQLASGASHTCAVTSSGGVVCWGNNQYGQLGTGDTANHLAPVAVVGLASGVVRIATMHSHTCALTAAGEVRCWGNNAVGQLGDASTTNRTSPATVSGLSSGVTAISVGTSHSCAVTSVGAAVCWGYNNRAQLGTGDTTNRSTPTTVSGLTSGVATISAGFNHTCVVTTAGVPLCWGDQSYGQTGNVVSAVIRYTPLSLPNLSGGVAALSAGWYHTCAVLTSGEARCWGDNGNHQLTDAPGNTSPTATPYSVGTGVASISASWSHTCAVTTAGAAKCWGNGASGQLGNNTGVSFGTPLYSGTPITPTGLSTGVVGISAGNAHTCAVTSSGIAKCWGLNSGGQLGDNTTADKGIPTDVTP